MGNYDRIYLSLLALCLLFICPTGCAGKSEECFCKNGQVPAAKLKGPLDDCSCHIETVDHFNNHKLYPRLNSLLTKDYFRFWQTNLKKPCPFWTDDSRCALRDCHVDDCSADEVPDGLRQNDPKIKNKYSKEAQDEPSCEEKEEEAQMLGALNTTISDLSKKAFESWALHDDAQHNFCELDDDNSQDMVWVDLLLNPERYTGYVGASPHRIWKSIYQENCFQPEKRDFSNFPGYGKQPGPQMEGMCLEKRVFYRLLSGLHSSINIHLCAMYLFPAQYGAGTWDHNLEEFKRRFDPELTNGVGPQRLKNLYFAWLVELRALVKAAPYLEKEDFYTGNPNEDAEVAGAIKDILNVARSFPEQFDETQLFRGNSEEVAKLKDEFKQHFRNISRIMDCVGCDKCKLWGKLQVTGMGTALKILFSGDMSPESTLTQEHKHLEEPLAFQLRRQEIIALVNAFGRLSMSIHQLEEFRRLLDLES